MRTESTEKLVTDFRVLIADAEELARATASQTGTKIADLRTRVEQSAAAIKPRLDRAQAAVKETAGEADAYVRSSPWAAAGLAAGIGFIVGTLMRRH
jgi:ElaB/YqjD/DUF883 family membrane-anchored ribosome-binding protein